MPSSHRQLRRSKPPQGPEIWSVPFDPNSEIAHNTLVEKMSSSSDGATPPQGPEIWSVPLDPNSEFAYNTVVDDVTFVNLSEGTALGDGGSLFSSLDVKSGFCTVFGLEGEERISSHRSPTQRVNGWQHSHFWVKWCPSVTPPITPLTQ